MRVFFYLSAALVLSGILLLGLRETSASSVSVSGSPRPELEYFKAINSVGPPQDPQILFLLMAQYSNANLQGEGVEFFSARLKGLPQNNIYHMNCFVRCWTCERVQH